MQAQAKPLFSEEGKHLGKPGHSLALRYELLLKELSHLPQGAELAGGEGSPAKRSGLTHTRVNTCFQILDEVLPSLGVYQRVMRLLRDELYAAVYSREYTSSSKRDPGSPQPLPHFVLAQKLMSKRASDMSKLKSEISSLEEQLYTCEADLEKASNTIESCRHDIKDREAKIHRLSSDLRLCCSENERLQKLEGQHQRSQERLRQEAEFRMISFKSTIGTLKEDKARLRVYKGTYDKLQDVFSSSSSKQQQKKSITKANVKTELEQQIASAILLKKQLLGMQNSLIEEYDVWMNGLTVGEQQSDQVLPAAVIRSKQNFQRSIAEITTELTLLEDHSRCLVERQGQLKKLEKASSNTALVLPAHPDNPLVPQQQVTSKYAIMVHSSSDGGSSYYSLKETQLCDSCGHQTVVCPHKAIRGDMTIQLPVNSTHLRISRPSLTVLEHTTTVTQPPPQPREEPPDGDSLAPDLTKLWGLFRAKYPHFIGIVPRHFTAEAVLSLIQQFYGELFNQDGHAASGEDQDPSSVLDLLFQYLNERYHIHNIASQVTFDFLTALSEHHSHYTEMSVLCSVLCGQLDGSTFRYFLLLANHINLLPTSSVLEVSPFFSILYPFLQDEDVEQLAMNFVAHGSNKISKQLLMEFFVRLLLRHKEPLVLMLEGKLMEVPTSKPEGMLEAEFAEAMEGLVPTVSDQLCKHLFLQCLMQYKTDHSTRREHLPVKKLSYIAAYLHSLCVEKTVRDRVEELVVTMTAQEETSTGQGLHMTLKSVRVVAERVRALSLCIK